MPNTTNQALPYPVLSDAPNVPQHIQALATAIDTTGVQVLGVASSTTTYGPDSTVIAQAIQTGWPTVHSVTVTIPSGLTAARRILVLGYSQVSGSIVGNIEMSLFVNDNMLIFGGDPRVPTPSNVSYSHNMWGMLGAGCKQPLPAAGSATFNIKGKNNTAGSFQSFAAFLAVILI